MKRKSFGKIGKKAAYIALCILLGSMLTGCGGGSNEPYVVTVDGTQIIPGTTTVQELENAGYEFSDVSGREWVVDEEGNSGMAYVYVYDLTSETEAMTVYPGLAVLKEGEKIASLSIVNDTQSEISISECKVVTVSVNNDDLEHEKASIEGVSFSDLSAEALTETLGKPSNDTESKTEWRRGDYTLQVDYEGGQVKSIRSSYPGIY